MPAVSSKQMQMSAKMQNQDKSCFPNLALPFLQINNILKQPDKSGTACYPSSYPFIIGFNQFICCACKNPATVSQLLLPVM